MNRRDELRRRRKSAGRYRVVWEVDIEAESPEEAALLARRLQQEPGNPATKFIVRRVANGRRGWAITLIDVGSAEVRARAAAGAQCRICKVPGVEHDEEIVSHKHQADEKFLEIK